SLGNSLPLKVSSRRWSEVSAVPSELLQDIGKTFQRYEEKETFENPLAFPPALKWRIWEFWDINFSLESVVKQVKDTLLCELQLQKENVTLDPGTAHPKLILSEDQKSLRWGEAYQDLPNNPERFDEWPFVLGHEGFTSGRHYWDVTVGSEEEWGVGVASRSLKRKGDVDFNPDQGIWAVGKWAGQYGVLKEPYFLSFPLTGELKSIRVSLNYTGRCVAFFDADRAALLFAFSALTFSGEDLHPFFFANGKANLILSH
ncbi:zinc finger protein RFP-like, partial [Sceloporus undulatus]|uniref:zinc finger protein RFP-like n=1 Tax=Sceloporus undulatus TaxID=8520 RepID=UPI001C4DAAF1